MTPSLSSTETPPPPPADLRARQRELWRHYHHKARGNAVEGELVQQYLPLVKTVVGRVAITLPSHVDIEDLHSAGLVGLLDALRHFDKNNGASFETYARIRIRGAVFDELRRMDWVPRSVHDKARKVEAAMQELERAKGRVPLEEEVARALGLSLPEYQQWLEEIKPATFICLDATHDRDDADGSPHRPEIADDSQTNPVEDTARRELIELILERLRQLPEMQRKVLALYYFEDLRLREIAETFGVTESRICQVHAQAILAIKSFLKQQESLAV